MGANSNIQWTDHTFNPWIGCTKVSPGCLYCYAEQLDITRFSKVLGDASKECPISHWGKGAPRHRTGDDYWKGPLRWNAKCQENVNAGKPFIRPRVFCASLADWLDEEVSLAMFADLLELVHQCQNLDWQLLTKRPQNWKDRVANVVNLELTYREATEKNYALIQWLMNWLNGTPPTNVWIGTTVEDQQRANERIPALLKIPANVRFLSCEPLLEAVDLKAALERNCANEFICGPDCECAGLRGIHWVICGGESGDDARPFCTEWAWEILHQCRRARVPFFMKQLGSSPITSNCNAMEWPEDTNFADDLLDTQWAAGGSVRLADKKGGDMAEWPEELKVQEFPR